METKKSIYLLIPVYNEEETIDTFIATCDRVLIDLKEKYNFYYLFADDGSKDRTLEILKEHANNKSYVKYISFTKNFGQESGLYACMNEAYKEGADAAIPMDVDLQDPPELIHDFVKYWEEGYEVIYAHMRSRKGQSFIKRFLSSSFYYVYAALTPVKKVRSGDRNYSLIDRKILKKIINIKDEKRFIRGIIAYCCPDNRKRIDYDYVERTQGTTKFPFEKMVRYSKNAILEFFVPLLTLSEFLAFASLVIFIVFLGLGLASNLWYNYLVVSISIALFVIFTIISIVLSIRSKTHHKQRGQIQYSIKENNLQLQETEK